MPCSFQAEYQHIRWPEGHCEEPVGLMGPKNSRWKLYAKQPRVGVRRPNLGFREAADRRAVLGTKGWKLAGQSVGLRSLREPSEAQNDLVSPEVIGFGLTVETLCRCISGTEAQFGKDSCVSELSVYSQSFDFETS